MRNEDAPTDVRTPPGGKKPLQKILLAFLLLGIVSLGRETALLPDDHFRPLLSTNASVVKVREHLQHHRLKVLVYITTHMSEEHKAYLDLCWPLALQNSLLLNSSDVAVYLTCPEMEKNESIRLLQKTFSAKQERQQNLSIYFHANRGKQASAKAAIFHAALYGYWDAYDWVIRLNPDVILRNDTWMLETMQHDLNASLLYIECEGPPPPPPQGTTTTTTTTIPKKVHTDFFAIQPGALPKKALRSMLATGAEPSFTKQVYPTITSQGRHRPIPLARPQTYGICRADGGGAESPVIHYHGFPIVTKRTCPVRFS